MNKTSRDLLLDIGVGDFNATMVVPFVLVSPATTDPKSPPVMIMVEAIQKRMVEMGAPVRVSRYLDEPTADTLTRLMGPGWMNGSWGDVLQAVAMAKRSHTRLALPSPMQHAPTVAPSPVGMFDLPDVPGGLLTYLVGGYLLYRYATKHK